MKTSVFYWNSTSNPGTTALSPVPLPEPVEVEDLTGVGPWNTTSLVVVSIYILLTLIICCVRSFTKIKVMKEWQLEDNLYVLASVLAVTLYGLSFNPVVRGGRNLRNVPVADLGEWFRWIGILSVIWNPTMMCAKWAVLLQIQSVFAPGGQKMLLRFVCRGLMGLCIIGYTILFFLSVFECTKLEALWDPERFVSRGRCPNVVGVFKAGAWLNVALNIFILLLPVWGLWNVQQPWRRKVVPLAFFSVNCFALICAIGRVLWTIKIWSDSNFTSTIVAEMFWSGVEIFFVLLACSAPILARFIKWIRFECKAKSAQAYENMNLARLDGQRLRNALSIAGRLRYRSRDREGDVLPTVEPAVRFQRPVPAHASSGSLAQDKAADGVGGREAEVGRSGSVQNFSRLLR